MEGQHYWKEGGGTSLHVKFKTPPKCNQRKEDLKGVRKNGSIKKRKETKNKIRNKNDLDEMIWNLETRGQNSQKSDLRMEEWFWS